ncbi:endonuclease NucS domain-containing protein [Achromobacter xylosoxidans]|uniref:endonuclease NucS domain-containing protein n=1 Tax=Alcaligenes xylosoxydans xylosoxydans TaxID=85698 RepID=UPI0006C5E0D5|nr:endonuclease NucS domain-containing protein [Achromobacter xylosoxidans]CUJ71591.1 Protein of uncharacterised function DUF91 [Achromobacter xylosoxidans]
MRSNYAAWLEDRKYAAGTQTAQLHRVKRVEEAYGDLDDHFRNGTLKDVVASLEYSTSDERSNKPNPSKLKIDGNIRNNLQSYKNAVVRYVKFLQDVAAGGLTEAPEVGTDEVVAAADDMKVQRFSLERDMQATLRKSITSLDPKLRIVDDGAERAVNSGLIDITCEDETSLVVVELKAGTADSRAIGQILGYMGDIQAEEEGRQVRGILVAHDFDKRARAAAKVG